MIEYRTILYRRVISIFIIVCFSMGVCNTTYAKKIYPTVCGCVYLHSGDSIMANDSLRVKIPKKRNKLELIDNAYTHSNKIQTKLKPEDTDSVVIWSSTATERKHTLKYIPDFGWCFEAERTPYVSVYCYASKGYHCSGNGGFWMYGKCKMFIIKDGEIYKFGEPHKWVDKKMRARLAALVADDVQYAEFIKSAKGRRDKVLRSLSKYNPKH